MQISQTFSLLSLLPCCYISSPVISKSTCQSSLLSVEEDVLLVLRKKVFYLICSWTLLRTKKLKSGSTRWDRRFIQLSILTVARSRCLQKSKRNGLACMMFALHSFRCSCWCLRGFLGKRFLCIYYFSVPRTHPVFHWIHTNFWHPQFAMDVLTQEHVSHKHQKGIKCYFV